MPIDPSIALAVKSPTFNIADPIEQFGQILSLRNLMQTGQMGQLDLQTKQLALEQERRRIQEQQNIINELNRGSAGASVAPPPAAPLAAPPIAPQLTGAALAPPQTTMPWQSGPMGIPGPTLSSLFAGAPAPGPAAAAAAAPTQAPPSMGDEPGLIGHLSASDILRLAPTTGMPWIKQALDMRKDELDLTIKHHDEQQKRWSALGGAAQAVQASQNPEAEFKNQLVDLYNGQTITAQELDAFRNHGYDPVVLKGWMDRAIDQDKFHTIQKTDAETRKLNMDQAVDDIANVNNQPTFDAFLTRHPELKPVLGATYSPDAVSAFQLSTTAKEKLPKAQMEQAAADAQVLAPLAARNDGGAALQAGLAKIGSKRAAPFLNETTPMGIYQAGQSPQERIASGQAAATLAQTTARDTATNLREGQRIAQENARIQIERQKNAREENIYQATYGTGANPALVGVDPKLRVQAAKEAQKNADEYLKANSAADAMQTMLDLSRAGNTAAGANLAVVGAQTMNALNGIKRLPRYQVEQYQGAGDLLDKIKGKIGGLTTGQKIPPDVMKDIESMHSMLRQNAESRYEATRQSINTTYKADFPSVAHQPATAPAASAPHTIQIGTKYYLYKGKGATDDMANYTEVAK